MSKMIPGNHSHLTLEDRLYIEEALNERKSFREIAKYLCKDPSTISKEVWNNRVVNTYHRGSYINPHNFCVHRFRCKKINACNKIEKEKNVGRSNVHLMSATVVIKHVAVALSKRSMTTTPRQLIASTESGS